MLAALFLFSFLKIISCQKCQCSPGDQCINLDRSLAASTLEEAVLNFVDPRAMDPKSAKNVLGETPSPRQDDVKTSRHTFAEQHGGRGKGCQSLKCKACVNELSQKIFGGGSTADGKCEGLKEVVKPVLKVLETPQINPVSLLTSRNFPAAGGAGQEMFTTESIGNSTQLKCDYKKGQLVDEHSPYVGLCSLCWSIRTLPENFTPRFINEKTCNNKDSDCLSKYGKCKQVYRTIDVLKNDGSQQKPEWTQYTLNSPIGCECQVPQGSALIDFVKK